MSSNPSPARAAAALASSELRYRRLFESAKDGILILDADTGVIEDANPFLLALLDYRLEEVVGKPLWDLGFLRDIVANRAHYAELSKNDYIRYDDKALETRSGARVEVEFISNVYRAGEHRVIQCNIRDVRRRKHTEAALHASRQLTDAIIDALPARVFWKDADLVYLGCNAAFAHDAGLADPADIIGKADEQMPWRAQAASYRADDLEVIASGKPKLLIEEHQTTPQGNTITLLTSKVPLRDESGEVIGVLGTYLDITLAKQAEESEARLAMAVQQADEAIVITDASGTILDVNPAFLKTSGYTREETVGHNPRILQSGKHGASFYQQMWSTLLAGQVWRGRLTNKRKDGTLYDEDATISPMFDAAGQIIAFVGVNRDVTEQERMAVQMRRAQRLESIGSLASGVAHDLNNALTPILMIVELLRLEFPDTASDDLDVIQAGAKRGADLVKQLLNFARGAEGERLPVRLKPLCTELGQLIHSTFPKNIELRVDCPDDLPEILGDATQLHQVVLNLLVNARDAMPDGGTISMEARPTEVAATGEINLLNLPPGPYIAVRVTDTGMGIPAEILDRIFDPFFTTKALKAGTGLGLSTSLGIVKGHGGFIRVYSVPGQGSTFAVYVPAHHADISDTASPKRIDSAFRGHGETILVVDDEPSVREIIRRVLTKLNFRVVTAAEGASALREVSERGTELAAVITDVHMPQLDGLSFVRVLRGRLPETAVIVVSGLVAEQERDEFAMLGVHALLDKPFTEDDLVKALRTIFVS
jgi:PAS domain S-box-containing protein